jgi:hypothetical protein
VYKTKPSQQDRRNEQRQHHNRTCIGKWQEPQAAAHTQRNQNQDGQRTKPPASQQVQAAVGNNTLICAAITTRLSHQPVPAPTNSIQAQL